MKGGSAVVICIEATPRTKLFAAGTECDPVFCLGRQASYCLESERDTALCHACSYACGGQNKTCLGLLAVGRQAKGERQASDGECSCSRLAVGLPWIMLLPSVTARLPEVHLLFCKRVRKERKKRTL